MTAVLPVPVAATTSVRAIGAPRLLAGLDHASRLDAAEHHLVHGALPGSDLDLLLALLDSAPIAGRGGAGFPLAAKIRALAPGHRRLVVNGTESEPASYKDRLLLTRSPHLVLDGAVALGSAIGAREITIAVHDETAAQSVTAAVRERRDTGRVRVRTVDGGFVGGEARAVLRSLQGGPARPTGRRTPPTVDGMLLGNVETIAQLAVMLRLGAHRFGATGSPDEPGTTLLSVSGAVARPGVLEVPLGTPLGIVLSAAGAAPRPRAVVVGGYHGSWLAPIDQIRLSRAGIAAAGGSFGAGVIAVVGDDTCALGELSRVADWLAAQSARQCGPCTFGLPALAADVRALAAGHPAAVGNTLGRARAVVGRGACAHPDGAARFVTSAVHLLQDEIHEHATRGHCGRPVRGHLPIGEGR